MNTPTQTISSDNAIDLIIKGKPLLNYQVNGEIDLFKLKDKIASELIFENCILENIISPCVEFNREVRFVNSHIYKCSFNYAYFIKGLTIDSCVFESYLDFEAGGHNQGHCTFSILNSKFKGFVNFFDCWFQSNVVIVNNYFEKGTNLLGNKHQQYQAQFDVEPIIENNRGQIDLDGEDDKEINTIILKRFDDPGL